MDLMDSLKWVFFSQQFYRLAAFRLNANRSQLITDNTELFASFFYVSLITMSVGYIGYARFFGDGDSSEIEAGELMKVW
jgi:hypothetical protein